MIQAILTDIEGTTSSLAFVKETLFPYAREHLPAFVLQHAQDPVVRDLLKQTAEIAGLAPDDTSAITSQLIEWIDTDQKITPLKALQGHIWEAGYQQQHYFGHIYEDAADRLKAWHAEGLNLYVYSSGSIHAQQLLFANTRFGDLRSLFSGYFDTTTGPKQDATSYQSIADAIDLPAENILFLSDIQAELDAAKTAGYRICLLDRSSTSSISNTSNSAGDFHGIHL